MFESTALLLRDLVHSLEQNDHPEWDERLETGRQCAYELFQMARSSILTYSTDPNSKLHRVILVAERANRAIPFVKLMNLAIRNIDRLAAIESGRAAIVEMNRLSVPFPVPPDHRAAVGDRSDTPAETAVIKSERRTKHHSTGTMRKKATAASS